MVSQTELVDVPPWMPAQFIGGHPALDFLNTESHRADPNLSVDRFNNLEKIVTWFVYTGFLDEAAVDHLRQDPKFQKAERELVEEFSALRARAGKIFDAIAESRAVPPADFAYILRKAGERLSSSDLVFQDGCWGQTGSKPPDRPDYLVGILTLEILDAFYGLRHDRLRACPNCRWLFYDSSRGGRRKWCSMQDCGNREKVRRHYRRHRTENGQAKG